MPTAALRWDFNAQPAGPGRAIGTFTSSDPAFTTISEITGTASGTHIIYSGGTTDPERGFDSTVRYLAVYGSSTTPNFTSGYYLSTKIGVPAGFTPTGLSFQGSKTANANDYVSFALSNDGFANKSPMTGANFLAGLSNWTRMTWTPSSTPVSGTTLELRIAVATVANSSNNRVNIDNILLEGTYGNTAPTGPVFSMWNGTTELPCTVQGVWNGSVVAPSQGVEVV